MRADLRVVVTWLVVAGGCDQAVHAACIHAVDAARDRAVVGTAAGRQEPIAGLVHAIAATEDPRVANTLALIDGPGRQLLALRSYVRSGPALAGRWSWTADEIAAYQSSPEYQALQAEIDRVRLAFSQANPGYELWVNPEVRSLEIQVQNWNTNDSVAEAAANILSAAREFVSAASFPSSRPEEARRAFRSFLAAYIPVPIPTIAAPGLSLHGQMRAIDFQVEKDGQTIAGPKTSTITSDWDEPGWTSRLRAVVHAASRQFVGPLSSPREPWHYTYLPMAGTKCESVAAETGSLESVCNRRDAQPLFPGQFP
jgi:hypothetical protein